MTNLQRKSCFSIEYRAIRLLDSVDQLALMQIFVKNLWKIFDFCIFEIYFWKNLWFCVLKSWFLQFQMYFWKISLIFVLFLQIKIVIFAKIFEKYIIFAFWKLFLYENLCILQIKSHFLYKNHWFLFVFCKLKYIFYKKIFVFCKRKKFLFWKRRK